MRSKYESFKLDRQLRVSILTLELTFPNEMIVVQNAH